MCLTSVQSGGTVDVTRHEGRFCLFPHGVVPHPPNSALGIQPRHKGALKLPTLQKLSETALLMTTTKDLGEALPRLWGSWV